MSNALPTHTRSIVLQHRTDETLNLEYNDEGAFAIKVTPLEPLQDGQVLVKVLYLSNEPSQRSMCFPTPSVLAIWLMTRVPYSVH